ncbi:MAG: helix-turn-helix domain-containing protein [Micrococcales bacterium]|nr:helix-turn-helix domain-containing protein [Micrococcales bacterium]
MTRMPPTSMGAPRGLPVADLVEALGGGLLAIGVSAPGAEVDDVTVAEPGFGVYGQAGDLLLGVGVESPEAAISLLGSAVSVGSGAVVLRRSTARRRAVRAAARRSGITLVELADHASWAHIVWLLRSLLDRVATGANIHADGPVHDELLALADACAALVDAPVTIEDTQSRVLAHSSRQDVADPIRLSTIVGRKVPDAVLTSLRGRGVFRRLARSNEPFYVPADGDLRARLVVPVRAGPEWLGSIWAVVDERPDTEIVRSLAQSASVVALHLLHLRSQVDLARRMSADRLRVAVSGDATEAQSWLPPGPWRIVALSSDPATSPERRLDSWESACRRGLWRQPLLTTMAELAVALVRELPGDLTPGTWDWLRALVADMSTTTAVASAAAGRPVVRPTELPHSLQDAREVHRLQGAGRVAERALTIEDAWAAVTCERAVSGIRDEAMLGPVTSLVSHDARHGSEYGATLAAWLDHPGDPRAAAGRLHVHPNTLRYRMSRLSDIVELDLADPQVRLALRLQLRVLGH